ncbi:MAG: S41 family peptidase [Patescibacteria group bacterium]|nr:S41 family peptidase [Patescibacteria group bacterium]
MWNNGKSSWIGIIIILTIVWGSGYWFGVTKGYYQRIDSQNLWLSWRQNIAGYESVPNIGLYSDVIDLLEDKYYGDIDYIDLLYGSIKGAVDSVGDSYTSFADPGESKEFFSNLNGTYEGVGIELDIIDDRLVIVSPLEGSPAKTAGLLPKDEILSIDGVSAIGMTLPEAVKAIHGTRGTAVDFIINRVDEDPFEVSVTRDVIRIPSVQLVEFRGDMAIMEIAKFSNDTEKLFNRTVSDILKKGSKGVVVDLRNNPGGFLDVGVKVTNEFLDTGMIVEERFKSGKTIPFYSDGSGRLAHLPIVVLVNNGSASASEILAGALQDNNRGSVMGMPTYGKGSVQEIEQLPDGSSLRVTVAHWYTPLGRSISQEGILPDILIEEGESDTPDIQLEGAIAELKKLISKQ